MRNIKLIIEYDGKGFNGWQKQPDKLNIQGEIEAAIEEITGEKTFRGNVNIAGPGFINVSIADKKLLNVINNSIIKSKCFHDVAYTVGGAD